MNSPSLLLHPTPQSRDKAVGKQLSGADKQNRMLSNEVRVSARREEQPNSPFVAQLSLKSSFQTMAFQILHGCDGLVNVYPQSDFPPVSETTAWPFSIFLTSFLLGAAHLHHHRTPFSPIFSLPSWLFCLFFSSADDMGDAAPSDCNS